MVGWWGVWGLYYPMQFGIIHQCWELMLLTNQYDVLIWCKMCVKFGLVRSLDWCLAPTRMIRTEVDFFCGVPDVKLEVHVTQHIVSTCDPTRAHSCWCLMILLLWFRHCFMAPIHIHPFGSCILSRLVWCLQFNGAFRVLLGSITGSW
jgi:hypothetical protein